MNNSLSKYMTLFLMVLGWALLPGVARADQSQFVNAKLETRAGSPDLQKVVSEINAESPQPSWIAYDLPTISTKDQTCCNYSDHNGSNLCGTCFLEEHRGNTYVRNDTQQNKTVELERSANVTILLRAERGRVMRIRIASSNCTFDAGGLRVVWLTTVKSEESVAVLSRFVDTKSSGDDENNLTNQAVMAIAQHADASADHALASFVTPNQSARLRETTAFWLGASRGKSGLTVLEKMATSDPDPDVRAKVAFALFVSHEPAAVDDIIHMAKNDGSTHVREQALFWLGQKAGQKASATIASAIDNDPDTEVKKKAVFALSQLSKDEGVPKLIEVAQTNKNPEVRKQAMFWLGQSNDPRAVAFFEKILSQ
jgi:HEAT repeats